MTRRLNGILLASCVFLGLLWPALASSAKPLLMPSILVLLVGTLLTLDPRDVRRAITTEGRLLGLICLWQLAGAPLLTAALISAHNGVVNALVNVALAVFALAVMDGVSARLISNPGLVAGFLLVAVLYSVSSQSVTALVFSGNGAVRALTAGLAAGYRNLALVLAMTGHMFGPDFGIYVGVAQIPMYVLPLLLTPLYRRFTEVAIS